MVGRKASPWNTPYNTVRPNTLKKVMKTWEAEQARDADKATAEEDAKRLAELEKFELENTGGVGNYKPSAATGTANGASI